jgi:hypothetical protein
MPGVVSGPMSTGTDIDRVFTQEETRVFRRNTVLMPYRQGLTWVNPVPIFGDQGKIIGFAALTRVWRITGDVLLASLAFDYQTPERLDVETGARRLYAHPQVVNDGLEAIVLGTGRPGHDFDDFARHFGTLVPHGYW